MKLTDLLENEKCIGITGHIRPDGDCIGSTLGLYNYLTENMPSVDVFLFLEEVGEEFKFLCNVDKIQHQPLDLKFDIFFVLDCSSIDRIEPFETCFINAKKTVCIDHHISNKGYAGKNIIDPQASSTCEVLYGLMEDGSINSEAAEALYTGIAFDSGIFSYSNTSKKTMEIAGHLMEKGIPFWEDIDRCFYQRTYTQTQLLGRTLLTSMLLMDGKCIVATITERMMEFYGAGTEDVEGIIEQLRITKGVEVAILLYETGKQEYKISLRSNKYVDVSKIAKYFGGGGHVKAAGFTMRGSAYDVINNITEHIEMQL